MRKGEYRYSATHSQTSHQMEVFSPSPLLL